MIMTGRYKATGHIFLDFQKFHFQRSKQENGRASKGWLSCGTAPATPYKSTPCLRQGILHPMPSRNLSRPVTCNFYVCKNKRVFVSEPLCSKAICNHKSLPLLRSPGIRALTKNSIFLPLTIDAAKSAHPPGHGDRGGAAVSDPTRGGGCC